MITKVAVYSIRDCSLHNMRTACVYEYSPDIKVEVVCLYSVDVVFQETFDGNALISEMSFKRDSTVFISC